MDTEKVVHLQKMVIGLLSSRQPQVRGDFSSLIFLFKAHVSEIVEYKHDILCFIPRCEMFCVWDNLLSSFFIQFNSEAYY